MTTRYPAAVPVGRGRTSDRSTVHPSGETLSIGMPPRPNAGDGEIDRHPHKWQRDGVTIRGISGTTGGSVSLT